jgi:predicted Zn-dependent protease
MAFGVGLIALYRVTADAYGDYAGLGVVGGILFAVTALLAAVAVIKARTIGPFHRVGKAEEALESTVPRVSKPDAGAQRPSAYTQAAAAPEIIPAASARDLIEPLAFFLSRYVKFPTLGNPAVDELVGNLRVTAHGSANEAIDRAANVIRHGSRSNLVFVLTGTAFLAWLLAHNSRRYP